MTNNLMSRLSVSTKLYFLVCVMGLVIIFIGIYGIHQMRIMEQNTKIIHFDELLSIDYLTSMRYACYHDIIGATDDLHDGIITMDSVQRRIRSADTIILADWHRYKATYLTPPEDTLIAIAGPMIDRSDSLARALTGVYAADSTRVSMLESAVTELMPDLNELIRLQVRISEDFYSRSKAVYERTTMQFILLIIGSVFFALALSFFIVRDTGNLISGLEQSRVKIANSEEKYRYLFDHTPAYIIIWDPDTLQVLQVNDMVRNNYGYTGDEWKDMSVLKYRPAEDRQAMVDFAKKMKDDTQPSSKKVWRHLMKDGSTRYMDIASHRIVFGGRLALLSLAEDVTEKHRAAEAMKKMNEQIKGLYEHLQTAREDERTYLAQEIHDELGQYLTVLKMDIVLIDKKISSEDRLLRERFDQTYAHLDLTVKTVRRIIGDLRPPQLDDIGITAAIEWHLSELGARTGMHCSITSSVLDGSLSPSRAIIVYRIYQEAITNILKHAAATAISVRLGIDHGALGMTVTDDGQGFDPEGAASGGFGIIGMRERAASVSGTLSITSSPGAGSTVALHIPI